MTLFRLVLLSSEGTPFVVKVGDVTFGGTREQVLGLLNGEWSYYRDRRALRYQLSCATNAIVVYVA